MKTHTVRVYVYIYILAEEIEVWSPSYPRSLETVWIGNNVQIGGTDMDSLFETNCRDSQQHPPSSADAGENVDNSRP